MSELKVSGDKILNCERTRQDDVLEKELFTTVLTVQFTHNGKENEFSVSHGNGNAGGDKFLEFADAVAALAASKSVNV